MCRFYFFRFQWVFVTDPMIDSTIDKTLNIEQLVLNLLGSATKIFHDVI